MLFRVLVIDDYVGGRASMCACISELGCEAIGASSRIADGDFAWPDYIDVIVANHEPPWTDGAKLVARLRRHAPSLPAIVLADPADRGALRGEVTLMKPLRFDELKLAIDRVRVTVESRALGESLTKCGRP